VRPERLGVIVGPNGETKRKLEEAFGVELAVDSRNATVYIVPGESLRPINVMRARQAIEAISLGFSPEEAMLLSNESYVYDVIDLSDIARKKSDLPRIKSRLIGEDGRAKTTIEQATRTKIVVSDKVVGILGEYDNVMVARKALSMLIDGRKHGTVYNYLRREARALRRKELQLWRDETPGPRE